MEVVVSPFLEYLVGLAPEGETLLLTEQKPTKTENKFVWPPCFPDKWKPGRAFYANTGSFILDRMTSGKLSASASNCEYVLFLVCDDIGTKSKAPPLKPTWKIETSLGNYQWGYAFSEQPTKGEFSAAMEAIAAAGYTDPGALNPVRNVRLPGSVNLKPGRNNFEAILTEFNKGVEYTLGDICTALSVFPAEPSTANQVPIKLDDNGNDDVLAWLNDQGVVLERANSSGWVGIVCPNHAEHTDGQVGGRYHPLTRSYCCLHSHCVDLKSAQFLEWVADQGGPVHEVGLRDDMLAETMTKVYAKLEKGDLFSDASDASSIIAEVERKELARIERGRWFQEWAYLEDGNMYFSLSERREVSRATFDALYRHIACNSSHANKRRIEASQWFDENRAGNQGLSLVGVTYAPGELVTCYRDGLLYGNRWVDGREPGRSSVTPGPWLRHVEALISDSTERNHLLDVMAFKLQNPGRKINHAVLLGGVQGCGKDTLFAPFFRAVCGPTQRNLALVSSKQFESQFTYAYESEIMLINELRPDDFKDRRALENQLKPIIAAPPEFLEVNRKGMHPHKAVNRTLVIAFSNFDDAIALPTEDRRWFIIWTEAPKMHEAEAKALWAWFEQRSGFDAVATWLMERNVSAFNPSAVPPMSEAKRNMIVKARSPSEEYVVSLIEGGHAEFARGVLGAPFVKVCDRLAASAPNMVRVTPSVLFHALKECGWVSLGGIKSRRHETKKQTYARPDMLEKHTRSDLRDMLEDVPMPHVVKVK